MGFIACGKCADSDQPAIQLHAVWSECSHWAYTIYWAKRCRSAGLVMASYTCKSNEISASCGPITEYIITLVAMESLGLFSSTSSLTLYLHVGACGMHDTPITLHSILICPKSSIVILLCRHPFIHAHGCTYITHSQGPLKGSYITST